MNNAVYVSEEGIAEASASLLSCASELSELFDNINSVTTSIGSNVSGFTEIETVVDGLKQINSAKEALVNKINEFANYLTENVNPGYNAFQQLFAGLLGSSGSLFENLGNLFGFGSLGGNGGKKEQNADPTLEEVMDETRTKYDEACTTVETLETKIAVLRKNGATEAELSELAELLEKAREERDKLQKELQMLQNSYAIGRKNWYENHPSE